MTSPLAELFDDLNAVFDVTNSRWYLFGAQAAIIHGASRLTADVDITVMLGDSPVETLVNTLTQKGFDLRISKVIEFVAQTKILPVMHIKSGIPVDIVLGGPGLEEEFAKRAHQYDFDGIKIPVASKEDIIAMKILSGREKDLDDALAIIASQTEQLDIDHIKSILKILEDALDRNDLQSILDDLIHRVHDQSSSYDTRLK